MSCELRDDTSLLDIMRATFPMGSMTGAPKESAVRHIAALEKRGVAFTADAWVRGARRRL